MTLRTFTSNVLRALLAELDGPQQDDDLFALHEGLADGEYGEIVENPFTSLDKVLSSRDYLAEAFDTFLPISVSCPDKQHVSHSMSDAVSVAMTMYMELSNESVAAIGWEVASLLHSSLGEIVDPKTYADDLLGDLPEPDDESEHAGLSEAHEIAAFVDAAVNADLGSAVSTMSATYQRVLGESSDNHEAVGAVVTLLGMAMYVTAPTVFRDRHGLDEVEGE